MPNKGQPELYPWEYWAGEIADFGWEQRHRGKKERIKHLDYSYTLPPKLRSRVKKIIDYKFDDWDENVFMEDLPLKLSKKFDLDKETDPEDENNLAKKKTSDEDFNESTCTQVLRLEEDFPKFDLVLDEPTRHEYAKKSISNWQSNYICLRRKDRVRWPSVFYPEHFKTNVAKTRDEQAAELMDASAKRFSEWMNSLSNHQETHISKGQVKSLFAVEGEKQLLASIQIEPKEVRAIAETVAKQWNLPKMALELKYEKCINDQLARAPKTVNKVAFGRTVPQSQLPWQPSKRDLPITTVFPEELLSMEKLFKGITHLKTTKLLIEFFKEHPHLERPRYLVNTGLFDKKQKIKTTGDVPLYVQLGLKY